MNYLSLCSWDTMIMTGKVNIDELPTHSWLSGVNIEHDTRGDRSLDLQVVIFTPGQWAT